MRDFSDDGFRSVKIDLQSIRETLSYIESDTARSDEYSRLTGALRAALKEIDIIETKRGPVERLKAVSARFFSHSSL